MTDPALATLRRRARTRRFLRECAQALAFPSGFAAVGLVLHFLLAPASPVGHSSATGAPAAVDAPVVGAERGLR